MNTMRRLVPGPSVLAAAAVGVVGLAACSADTGDFRSDAESFIEDSDDLAEATGQSFDDASCVEPARVEVDEEFTCTATADDGTTWHFVATIRGDDSYEITDAEPAAATETTPAPAASSEAPVTT